MAFVNRLKTCKNTIGGVKNAYLAPYKKVFRSELGYDGVTLTEFPQTFIYKFELVSGDVFEQAHNNGDGGKYYEGQITLTFNTITALDNQQFQRLLKKDYWLVIEDNNGNFFLMGLRNGATADSLDVSTAQQYKIKFSTMEEEIAPFCEQLMGTDLIILDPTNKIFQDGTNFIFQNDYNFIFQ